MNKMVNSPRLVPPPEKMTWQDVYRFILGLLMIPLGITIFVRAYESHAISPLVILLSIIFIAFGTYRIYVGIIRYRIFRSRTHA
jgi:hypothetical protein